MEQHKSKDLYTTEAILKITLKYIYLKKYIYVTLKKAVMDKTLKIEDIQKTNSKIADVYSTLSVISFNVNELNNSIKKKILAKYIIQLHAVCKRHTFKIQVGWQ